MEKFAVDLDAVLDEFEFHEDQVRIGKKCHLTKKKIINRQRSRAVVHGPRTQVSFPRHQKRLHLQQ